MIKTNIEDIYNTDEEPKKIDYNITRNIIYFNRRKELYNLIKSINNYINNNSKSLFLTIYFMDTIFTNDDLEQEFFNHFTDLSYLSSFNDIQMNNYVLLSLACLILTHKFSENDPKIPSISSFIKLAYHFSKKKYYFKPMDLIRAEVVVVKLLKYKLNYYTIYHFLVFFFTHGIIFETSLQRSQLSQQLSEKKILEKIYVETRDIIDWIIESNEYFNYFYGKDNHLIIVEIFLWSIEHVLGIRLSDNENIFKLIYNIREKKSLQMKEIIEKLYKMKKGNVQNHNRHIFNIKNNSKKPTTLNNPVVTSASILTNNNSNYNFNSSQNNNQKYITSSYNNNYNNNNKDTLPTNDESFSIYNGIIHNELDKFNSNYFYQYPITNKMTENYKGNNTSSSKVISSKNRNFYNSNKNIISNYDINSLIPIETAQVTKLIPSSTSYINMLNNESILEKEPTDNNKNKKKKNKNPKDNMCNYTNKIKRIYLNNGSIDKKKCLSCTKNSNNAINSITSDSNKNNNTNCHIRSTFIDTSFISNKNNNNGTINSINDEDELMFEEKINRPKVFANKNKVNINNYLYSVSPDNKPKNDKKTLYKKFQQSSNKNHNGKKINKNKSIINKIKNIPKSKIISTEELINRTKNLYTVTKINKTIENEPRDNNKRSLNKIKNTNGLYSINSCNNINRNNKKINNNKKNTIIINHNIHINTYFDKNIDENKSPDNTNIPRDNTTFFVYDTFNERNVNNDVLFLPKYNNNKYNNNNNIRQKFIYNYRNENNIINKSNTITNNYNSYNGGYIYSNQFQF